MTRCNTPSGIPGTHRSGAKSVNNCPLPKGASLNTGFPTPFLRSLMLRTCERALSAGTTKVPSPSPSGKRILSCWANTLHRGAHCFPISRSSSELDWRTEITVFGVAERTVNFKGMNHLLYIGPQSPDTWLLFRIRVWLTRNLLCNEF